MNLKVEKWNTLFRMHDLDHNKVFNKDDVDIQWNAIKSIYNMENLVAESVKRKLYMFWKCLFPDSKNTLSVKDFIAKGLAIDDVHKYLDFYIDVMDYNNDGYISVPEFDANMKSLNLGNEMLVQKRFETMCGAVLRCPVEKISDDWAEVYIGDDRDKYELIKNDYETAGMPLDELVE